MSEKPYLHKGILHQLSSKPPIDSTITKESLIDTITKVFRDSGKNRRNITVWTGLLGYYNFNWVMLFGDTIKRKHFHHEFKKVKIIYVSLFKKHGPYKVRVKDNTFYFYKGTVLLRTIENVRNGYEYGDALSHINETKAGMNQVNSYIDILYNESLRNENM